MVITSAFFTSKPRALIATCTSQPESEAKRERSDFFKQITTHLIIFTSQLKIAVPKCLLTLLQKLCKDCFYKIMESGVEDKTLDLIKSMQTGNKQRIRTETSSPRSMKWHISKRSRSEQIKKKVYTDTTNNASRAELGQYLLFNHAFYKKSTKFWKNLKDSDPLAITRAKQTPWSH